MIDWAQGGWAGSIRRLANRELKEHFQSNERLRRARYPVWVRLLRAFFERRSFSWFAAVYVAATFQAIALEIVILAFAPNLAQSWIPEATLESAFTYFIAAQVGTFTAISLAIGLISILAHQQNWKIHVRIYYHESLAFEVFASMLALIVVLCVQVFWPVQILAIQFGFLNSAVWSKVGLTLLHTGWLILNLGALAYFVAQSLRFVEPDSRAKIREAYTANWALRRELPNVHRRVLYIAGHSNIFDEAIHQTHPDLFFGSSSFENDTTELEDTFRRPVELYDVRMRILSFALHRWWSRCITAEMTGDGIPGMQPQSPLVVFSPSFGAILNGHNSWCRRRGGLPFDAIEKFLIRRSFSFRKARSR